MNTRELDDLIREYSNSTAKEDIIIKLRLEGIRNIIANCGDDEMIFANEITTEFCRLIRMLQDNKRAEVSAVERALNENLSLNKNQSFMTLAIDRKSYEYGWEVQEAFYDFFRDKEQYPAGYLQVLNTPVSERKGIVCLTLMDYISRIKSFAKYDLEEMYPLNAIPNNLDDRFVFIYDNIESIIASYDASSDDETDKKRRMNMRSALRKLNDFKYGRRTK
jgi:hypothetical protein